LDGSQGGRPPFDPVILFKVLIIQAANNLSDERAEFLISDSLSFMRFLGLSLSDRMPDARTIWLFREKPTKADAIQPLFDQFEAALRTSGYIALGGIEACATAHHWGRTLAAMGHEVRLIPPSYVKAYLKRGKSDALDAEAICE
jgi:hypothetical protein